MAHNLTSSPGILRHFKTLKNLGNKVGSIQTFTNKIESFNKKCLRKKEEKNNIRTTEKRIRKDETKEYKEKRKSYSSIYSNSVVFLAS